jgi:hypothetical protein
VNIENSDGSCAVLLPHEPSLSSAMRTAHAAGDAAAAVFHGAWGVMSSLKPIDPNRCMGVCACPRSWIRHRDWSIDQLSSGRSKLLSGEFHCIIDVRWWVRFTVSGKMPMLGPAGHRRFFTQQRVLFINRWAASWALLPTRRPPGGPPPSCSSLSSAAACSRTSPAAVLSLCSLCDFFGTAARPRSAGVHVPPRQLCHGLHYAPRGRWAWRVPSSPIWSVQSPPNPSWSNL